MIVLRLIWWLLGVGATCIFGYYAIRFTGAWIGYGAMPTPSETWMALAFWGATIFAATQAYEEGVRYGWWKP